MEGLTIPPPGVIGLRKGKEKSKVSTFSKSGKSVPKDKVQLPFLTDQETSEVCNVAMHKCEF